MRQRIAIDMDGVIADPLSRELSLYNTEFQGAFTPDDVKGRQLYEVVPAEHASRVRKYPTEEGFFKDLPVLPHCQEVIQALQEKYEVFIASAAMQFRNSFVPKHDWLQAHFPFIPWTHIIFCGHKHFLHADYLIDDMASNFKGFRGEGILFSAPHNHGVTGYRRVDNWLEVRALFLS